MLVILFIIIGTTVEGGTLLTGLFIGFVQVISIVMHVFLRREPWTSKLRTIYYWLLLLLVGSFVYAKTMEREDKYSMPELEVMLYIGLVSYLLGLFYFIITIIEWRRLKKQTIIKAGQPGFY